MAAIAETVQRKSTRRERWAWYIYDFGNSAYASVVLLAVYSAYFQGQVVGGAEGSRLWGRSIAIAMITVAIIAPILGAIADYSAFKKRFLFFFTTMSVIFTGLLFFVEKGDIVTGMLFFILAEIGYRSAQVFYDGLLPEIASHEEMGSVSGKGWAIGSAGGVVCLLIILPLIVLIGGTFIVRLSLVITAVFWALSSIPIFLWLPERAKARKLGPGENYLSLAFRQLGRTISTARHFKEFIKFMVAYLIFNDGVIMALDFAAIMGAVLFGMEQQMLIVFVIIVNVTNVFGAYLFGILVDKIGGKRSLIISIGMMLALVIAIYFATSQTVFIIIGALAGIAMAGIQSVARTMVGLFSPRGQSAEFYGFFAVVGRTSSFIGPAVYGFLAAEAAIWYMNAGRDAVTAEQLGQRIAILSIAAFLLVGVFLLQFVNEKRIKEERDRNTRPENL
jgi:UMF1 family MFS transporter